MSNTESKSQRKLRLSLSDATQAALKATTKDGETLHDRVLGAFTASNFQNPLVFVFADNIVVELHDSDFDTFEARQRRQQVNPVTLAANIINSYSRLTKSAQGVADFVTYA